MLESSMASRLRVYRAGRAFQTGAGRTRPKASSNVMTRAARNGWFRSATESVVWLNRYLKNARARCSSRDPKQQHIFSHSDADRLTRQGFWALVKRMRSVPGSLRRSCRRMLRHASPHLPHCAADLRVVQLLRPRRTSRRQRSCTRRARALETTASPASSARIEAAPARRFPRRG